MKIPIAPAESSWRIVARSIVAAPRRTKLSLFGFVASTLLAVQLQFGTELPGLSDPLELAEGLSVVLGLERAARRLVARTQPPSAELLARVQAAVGNAGTVAKPRLPVREGTGHRLIALEEIGRFTAASGATQAHVGAARFGTDYTMAELEDRTRGRFVRASRAEIVNIDHVQRFVRDPDGTAHIVLRDGTRVSVSRRRATEVRQALEA